MTANIDPNQKKSQRGFALIVTLTLMVLLSILALGLLSLSSVAIRSSSQGEANAVARANARIALMMAIGELQRQMGPDSRISAPQDANPEPPPGGEARWTAVYDAWKWNADAATPEIPASRTPTFRGWLVSGANQASGGPPGTGEFATLVGPASLSATSKPEDQIKAPMLAVSSGNRKGRIAWWTTDESIKAKINAGGEASLASNPLSDSQSPRHVGHKAVTELAGFDWKPGQRSISVSTGEANLAAGMGAAGLGRLNHDVTVHSSGVLADVRQSGLKLDLSNLLSRPIAELMNKPLYLADGRMNRFQIGSDGSLTNNTSVAANGIGADRWGINLEELHLFHEIHREVDWGTGKPQLVNKGSETEIFNDRFSMYRIPTLEAVSLILALIATDEPKSTPTAATTYRIDATMDVIVSLSNPNDIPTVWPAGLAYRVDTEGFPYRPRWNIQRPPANTVVHSHTVQEINSGVFGSSILGGFTLEAGEAAVFGAAATSTSSQNVNLTRGYAPRGALKIDDKRWDSNNVWNPATDGLRATGLRPTDKMDFTMIPSSGGGNTPSGWLSSYARIGGSGTKIRNFKFGGGGNSAMTTAPANTYMPSSIKPQATSTPTVRDFIGKPMPVLMVTTMSNVERSRTALTPPNALPSRPYLLHEPATATMTFITNQAGNVLPTMQSSQLVAITETMDYAFGNDRTMAAGTGGRNLYHGGAREVGLGGNFYVVKRRIPLAAPLSLGAFENAIACGFDLRTGLSLNGNANNDNARNQNLDPNTLPHNLPTLPKSIYRGPNTGWEPRASMLAMAKSIGNSWTNPFLASDRVQDGTYHDPSWMANTALWDSWFLSGITNPGPSGAWGSDSRSQRQQFMELAERTATLRNARLTYHPHKPTTEALAELFNGDNLKPDAINKLTKYLLVDGAFNVNSTSESAWKAFLTSVRDQELYDANGAVSKKNHPFGTLGHAVKSATSGTEGDWAGFRDLSDSELDGIAKAIVTEVKARGPFLNMADFVNRRPNSSDATHRALGALQAAIDKSGINKRFTEGGRRLEPADVPMFAGKDTLDDEPDAARAVGAAGFLSQGALLTAFGSQITVRGDTFIIRTYGDCRNAADKIEAQAWCEAVVQRNPEYVDPANPPEQSSSLSPQNETFGREFSIVSFRWLSQDEI
jgi:type II secretory pathway pseudopilin PulG